LNKATDVVAENLAQRFVYLRRLALAPQTVAELRLYHAKGRLDVRALVVVLHELFRVVRVEVKHGLPGFCLKITSCPTIIYFAQEFA
jgi:hypothetical protein